MNELNEQLTSKKVLGKLVAKYREIYADYERYALMAKELAQYRDRHAFRELKRKAHSRELILEGITAAAEALGISDEEFMKAVNSDRERTESDE